MGDKSVNTLGGGGGVLDGVEPENDTTSHHQIPLFIFWGEGGQVLRLSKQDTTQKQVCVRPGIEGTYPPLTFGIMSGMNFCPPKPGSMVITRTMSTRETNGTTSSTDVPGLMPIPTWGGGGRGKEREGKWEQKGYERRGRGEGGKREEKKVRRQSIQNRSYSLALRLGWKEEGMRIGVGGEKERMGEWEGEAVMFI